MNEAAYTTDEMMTVSAARMLRNKAVCFVGIGLPSTAANLARLTHAPDAVLIYESGPIGAKPNVLPLSIGDRELAETADTYGRFHTEDFPLLAAGRPRGCEVPGRRAAGSLRQPEHHRHRRLPAPRPAQLPAHHLA
jgi:acyl CoA:acetate/3-ketoacid CoA transferase beta subunit